MTAVIKYPLAWEGGRLFPQSDARPSACARALGSGSGRAQRVRLVPAPCAWCSAGSSGQASRGPGKAHALPRVAVGAGSWLGRLKREQPQHEEQLLVASPLLCAPCWVPRARPKSRRPQGCSVTAGARTSLARPRCAGSAPLLGPYSTFFRSMWREGGNPQTAVCSRRCSVPEAGRWVTGALTQAQARGRVCRCEWVEGTASPARHSRCPVSGAWLHHLTPAGPKPSSASSAHSSPSPSSWSGVSGTCGRGCEARRHRATDPLTWSTGQPGEPDGM